MPSDRVNLTVTEVQLAVPASVGVEAGMVVLTEDQPPGRMLRIIIAQPEARAIMSAWQGAVPGRPSTWDLLQSAIALLGGRVNAVVITAVEEERHYFATLEIWQDDERRTLSCRPSDGIALALRAYSQLLAEESVMEAAGVLADGSRPPPKAKLEPKPDPARTLPAPTAAQAMGVPGATAPMPAPPADVTPAPADALPPPADLPEPPRVDVTPPADVRPPADTLPPPADVRPPPDDVSPLPDDVSPPPTDVSRPADVPEPPLVDGTPPPADASPRVDPTPHGRPGS